MEKGGRLSAASVGFIPQVGSSVVAGRDGLIQSRKSGLGWSSVSCTVMRRRRLICICSSVGGSSRMESSEDEIVDGKGGDQFIFIDDDGTELGRGASLKDVNLRPSREYSSIAEIPRTLTDIEDEVFPEDEDDEDVDDNDGDMLHPKKEESSGGRTRPFIKARQDSPDIDWSGWVEAGLTVDKKHCPGCGQPFQTDDIATLGYITQKKLDELAVQSEEVQKSKPTVCTRCYDLKFKNNVDNRLTVGGVDRDSGKSEDVVAPSEFLPEETEKVLRARLRAEKSVVLYLIDAVDFNGTSLDLTRIIGTRNPVILGINKCDLLPKGFSTTRLKKWMQTEAKKSGLEKIYDIHILSSLKGYGVKEMLNQAYKLAKYGKCNIYVVGAANVGKSSFINDILRTAWSRTSKPKDQQKLLTTTSVIPGTTLGIVPISASDGMYIYDTPGVILSRNITTRLTPAELRAVLPSSKLETFGFRFEAGSSLLFGGLARIDYQVGPAVLGNWFCSDGVKVHLRATKGVENFVAKSVGTKRLYPPIEEDESYNQRWEWVEEQVEIEGTSWKMASADIVIAGLGWISVTFYGRMKAVVRVPKGVGVYVRAPLLPYEAVYGVGAYTGGKWMNRYKEQKLLAEKEWRSKANNKSARQVFPDYEARRMKNFRGFPQ